MKSRVNGIAIPAPVSQAPLPLIPFLPFKMKRPVKANTIKPAAYKSENQVHNRLGVL